MNNPAYRLPQLADAELDGLPPRFAEYCRRLSRGLHEMSKTEIQSFQDLDTPPVFQAALTGSQQSISANTLTTVHLNTVVADNRQWFNSGTYTYTPLIPGYYRVSWTVDFTDIGGAVATSTYAYSQINSDYFAFNYGTGGANDISTNGSAIMYCYGATGITLKGLILTGFDLVVRAASAPYRTWLSVDYIGR